jgi:cytochrome P450
MGEPLSRTELLHNCIFLLNAGHETTTNLIANALHALTQWPGERARLLAHPELINTAVEEFLRFESSNQLGNRIAARDTTVGGVEMLTGTQITLCIGREPRSRAISRTRSARYRTLAESAPGLRLGPSTNAPGCILRG